MVILRVYCVLYSHCVWLCPTKTKTQKWKQKVVDRASLGNIFGRNSFLYIGSIHFTATCVIYERFLHCNYLPLDHPWVAIEKGPFFGPWPKPPWRRRHSVLILWFSKSHDDKIENIRGMLRIVRGFNSLHNVEERERENERNLRRNRQWLCINVPNQNESKKIVDSISYYEAISRGIHFWILYTSTLRNPLEISLALLRTFFDPFLSKRLLLFEIVWDLLCGSVIEIKLFWEKS